MPVFIEKIPPGRPVPFAWFMLQYIMTLQASELDRIIRKVGFHNNKTKFLQQASALLLDNDWGDPDRLCGAVPASANDLLALPGPAPAPRCQ